MTAWFNWLRTARERPTPPVPDEWRSFLSSHYAHYRRLPSELQEEFQQGAARFLARQRITGIEMRIGDDLRLLVAASAVTLSVGWPGYAWKEVAEVLLYPDYFDADFIIGGRDIAGLAHPWGTIILSAPALRDSFRHSDDGYHVGLHEFAHLLDVEQGRMDGIPRSLRTAEIREWLAIQENELRKVQRGESVIETLGRDTAVEFFPSAVEAFFERPIPLQQRHPHLYEFLNSYFGQDPATWEAARRDRLKES